MTWFRHTYIQKTQQQYKTVTVNSGDKQLYCDMIWPTVMG